MTDMLSFVRSHGLRILWALGAVVLGGETSWAADVADRLDRLAPGSIYHEGWIDLNKNGVKDPYEDPAVAIEQRIEDLIARMTVNEKTAQMATLYGYPRVLEDVHPVEEKWAKRLWRDGIGNIDEHANGISKSGRAMESDQLALPLSAHAETMNGVQRFFIEQTRLGVPADFTNEGVRGIVHPHATSFPSPLGVASSWDVELAKQIGHATGVEAKALGFTHVYAPILDLPRDPRWGRVCECYSEDPVLTAAFGVAMVEGLHAAGAGSTCKHFAVYGIPNGGRDGAARTDPQAPWQEVEMLHLHPFREVIRRAHPEGVMASYNDYGGTPIEASRRFLTDILREEWGFDGYVVSDSGAVEDLQKKHRVAADAEEAIRLAVDAGLNVRTNFTQPEDYVQPLRALVADGRISLATIDDRVRDVLRVKFRLGLFDRPYVEEPERADAVVRSNAHRRLARKAAEESIVLLKNARQTLPLSKSSRRILVTGPLADAGDAWWDRYGPQRIDYVTPLEGIRAKLGSACDVQYAPGCPIVDDRFPLSDVYKELPDAKTQTMIDEAVSLAEGVDAVVAVLGEDGEISREDRSRVSLDLPGHQENLLRALYATGKPVVLVLSSGRPLAVSWADDHVPAIVCMWFSNEQGGEALADVLFGDVNPSGKLPITFPRTVGQIPIAFPAKPGAQAADGGQALGPLYPFGYGLSYTQFEYSSLEIKPNRDGFEATCKISNVGDKSGTEIVQLYVRDDVSSVTTFDRTLLGFHRVSLAPGETKDVSFTIHSKDVALYDSSDAWVAEPGVFTVWISSSSVDDRLTGAYDCPPSRDARSGIEECSAVRECNISQPSRDSVHPTVPRRGASEHSSKGDH